MFYCLASYSGEEILSENIILRMARRTFFYQIGVKDCLLTGKSLTAIPNVQYNITKLLIWYLYFTIPVGLFIVTNNKHFSNNTSQQWWYYNGFVCQFVSGSRQCFSDYLMYGIVCMQTQEGINPNSMTPPSLSPGGPIFLLTVSSMPLVVSSL